MKNRTWFSRRAFWAAVAGLLAAGGATESADAQTMLGVVREMRMDGSVHLDLTPGSPARAGILAFVVRYDDEVEEWFPVAEIALESIGGGIGIGQILESTGWTMIMPGDNVAIYEPVREDQPSLRVSPPQMELIIGETAALEAELVDAEGRFLQSVGARWRSSNESVASVNDLGRVVAVSTGEALVIGQASGGVIAAATVRVVEPRLVIPDSLLAFVGVEEPVRIGLEGVIPRPVSPQSFRWSIDDPAVATIDAFGILRPVAAGMTQVRLSGLNRTAVIPLRILETPADVHFSPIGDTIRMVQGEILEVEATIRFVDGTTIRGLAPRITSATDVVLEVTGPGAIQARRSGEGQLQVAFGGAETAWTVLVIEPSVMINLNDPTLLIGDSIDLEARFVTPAGGDLGIAGDAVWTVSDPAIARVEGGRLITTGPGPVQITARRDGRVATKDLYVLGDVLLTLKVDGRWRIHTVSFTEGRIWPLPGLEVEAWAPALSPDGTRLALVSGLNGSARNPRVMIKPLRGGALQPATMTEQGGLSLRNPGFQEHSPVWSSRGNELYFLSNRTGSYAAWAMDAERSLIRRLSSGSALHRSIGAAAASPTISVERAQGSGRSDILIILPDGSDQTTVIGFSGGRHSSFAYGNPRLLPDGRGAILTRRPSGYSRGGEELVRVDFGDDEGEHRVQVIVPARRDHDVLHAVSSDGTTIAYVSRSEFRRTGGSLILSDLEGRILASLALPDDQEIKDLSWGMSGRSSR